MKFEIFKGSNKKYYFRLKSNNGQVVLASQGYKDMAGAKKGVAAVKANCKKASAYSKSSSKNGKFFFEIKAGNGETVAVSQMYASKATMSKGINSVKGSAPKATIVAETLSAKKRVVKKKTTAKRKPVAKKKVVKKKTTAKRKPVAKKRVVKKKTTAKRRVASKR